MTKQQMIEFIRQKCVAANPEIVELKFGCVIQMTGLKQPKHIKKPVPISSTKRMGDGCWEVHWGCFHPVKNKKEYIIIGRNIRLADVLLAIEKVKDQTQHGKCVMILCNGWGEKERWDLRQDNLNDQDEPTIRFIYELLK